MPLRKIPIVTALCAALLAVAACSSNNSASTTTSPSSPSSGSSITAGIVVNASLLTSTAYTPNPIVVHVGDSVTWTNNDTTAHTSIANNGAWASGTINPGGSFKTTFSAAGTFPYHCSIHPNMIGTVTVQ